MKLICVFVFAYAKSRFSHDEAHLILMVLENMYGKCATDASKLENSFFLVPNINSLKEIINSARAIYIILRQLNAKFVASVRITDMEFELHHNKTYLCAFRPGPTQTGLYNHRKWLDT